jgi:hypothetical protein
MSPSGLCSITHTSRSTVSPVIRGHTGTRSGRSPARCVPGGWVLYKTPAAKADQAVPRGAGKAFSPVPRLSPRIRSIMHAPSPTQGRP